MMRIGTMDKLIVLCVSIIFSSNSVTNFISESRKSQSSFNENNHAEDIINDDESVISAPPPTATIELPARRPYMNTGAIDSHKSAFAHETSNEADESELSEPQYANVGPNKYYNEPSPPHIRQTSNDGLPVPPYMPMQQSTSKRSTCLEKKIKRKKEKEGCKQQ